MIKASNINLLRWFFYKSFLTPFSNTDFVLDVGGGDKPFWRANVVLDKYLVSKSNSQRFSGMPATRYGKQFLVEGDAENMPFKDKSFDYVYCSHLLEHVHDPEKVLRELMRVGEKGYIEVPTSWKQKIIDMPSHLWYVSLQDNILTFTAKMSKQEETEDYRVMRKLFEKYDFTIDRSEFMTSLYWNKKIGYRIEGTPNLNLLTEAENLTINSRSKKTFFYIYKFLSLVASYIAFWKSYKGRVQPIDILRCPECKNHRVEIDNMKQQMICGKCKHRIIIQY